MKKTIYTLLLLFSLSPFALMAQGDMAASTNGVSAVTTTSGEGASAVTTTTVTKATNGSAMDTMHSADKAAHSCSSSGCGCNDCCSSCDTCNTGCDSCGKSDDCCFDLFSIFDVFDCCCSNDCGC